MDTIKTPTRNDKLKNRRIDAGLSQSQIARQSGVNFRVYQYYEQGTKDINKANLATLLRICNTLGCGLADIVTDQDILDQLAIYKG